MIRDPEDDYPADAAERIAYNLMLPKPPWVERDPEDVMNDGRDAMKEIKERMDWDVHALPRLMETLNDQIYRLEMSIADHRPKKETLEVLRAMSTTIGLMSEVCE
jgi:hypothetical protein